MFSLPGKGMFRTPKPFSRGGTRAATTFDYANSADAAYSLALLRSAYAGPCLRVRRSSDNAEQDIGFSSNVLDTVSLLSFVGTDSGFVTKWYDQSGNGLDVSQGTASKQPRIVNSGTVDSSGGVSGILFTAASFQRLENAVGNFQPTPAVVGVRGNLSTLSNTNRGVFGSITGNNGVVITNVSGAGQLQAKSASSTFTSSHNVTLGAWESWEWHSVAAADSSLVVLNGAEQTFTGTWSLQTGATGLKIGMYNTTELDGRFNFNGYLRAVILKRGAMSAADKSVMRVGLGM